MKEKLLELAAEKKFEELIEFVILEKKKIKTEEKEKMIKFIKELASFKEEIKKSKSTNQELEKFAKIYKKNKQNWQSFFLCYNRWGYKEVCQKGNGSAC